MRKKTPNEKVLRAISIGLAAMIAIQPVMATPVFAGENDDTDEKVAPEPKDNKSFESNDTSEGLKEIQDAGKAAETSTNASNCGNALDQAVSAGRDSNVVNSTMNNVEFDKNGGQAINAVLNSITNEETGIQNIDDKFAIVDATGNVVLDESGSEVVLDIVGERQDIAADAQKLVEEAKRGDSSNYDKTTGTNKNFDAYEIMQKVNDATLDGSLKGKELTEAANALDKAITDQSKELGSFDISEEANTIEEAKDTVDVDKTAIENATSIDDAKEALDDAEAAKNESNAAYGEAVEKYYSASAAYEEEKAAIEDLKEEYKSLLQNQIADGSKIRQVEKELNQAQENLIKLEEDAKKAQTDLANTVIGKMADAFSKTEKSENWTQLDVIFKDVIKYYYFPMVEGIDASEVTFGKFEKNLKDANYLEVIVNGESRYFNYKSKYSDYDGKALNDKIVIFEKNKEVEVAEHYEDSSKNTVDVDDAVNVLDISSVENGLVVNTNDETGSKYYKVVGEGTEIAELKNESGVRYSYENDDIKEEYTIDEAGNLVKTKMATSVTKTTYTSVSLDEKTIDVEYSSEEDAKNAAKAQADSLGENANYSGVKVDEYSEFSTKIDLGKVTNNSNKASEFAEYVNGKLGDSVNLSSDGTIKLTLKDSIDELLKKIEDKETWSDYRQATNGNVSEDTVKELIKSAVEGLKDSTPATTYYKLTLLDLSYDEIISREEMKDQVISKTTWATDALTHVETKYKDGPATLNDNFYNYVENNIKNGAIIDLRDADDIVNKAVREDIAKVNTLKTLYKNAENAAKTSRTKVEKAQDKVDKLIKAIQGEIDSLDGKVDARLVQLESQLAAAKAELDAAEQDNKAVEEAYEEAKEAYENAVVRLTPVAPKVDAETETSAPAVESTTSDSEAERGTTTPTPVTPSPTLVTPLPVVATSTGGTAELPIVGEVEEETAGVAGARTARTDASIGDKAIDEVTGGAIEGVDKKTQSELQVVEENKNIVKTIKDEEIPLASFDEEATKKISWWWLLLIAALGATGEEMYRRHKKKKEELASVKTEINDKN